METYAVNATAPLTGSTAERGVSQMTSGDFFKLLVTELQQQDPLEPTKTADMISQVSQIRSIELSHQLTTTLEQLTRQQRTAGASELLGKLVEATALSPDGTLTTIAGVVTAVRFGADGVALLELDSGEVVRAAAVTRVTTLEAGVQAAAASGSDDDGVAGSDSQDAKPPAKGLQLAGALQL